MIHGKDSEKEAIEVYKGKTGYEVDYLGLVVLPEMPWAGYSPDGIASTPSGGRLIEVKSPEKGQTMGALDTAIESFDFLDLNKDLEFELKKKHKYYGQVQLGMAICNLKVCDLIVYASYSHDYYLVTVPFDEPFVKSLLMALKCVYFKYKLPFLKTAEENIDVEALEDANNNHLNEEKDVSDGLNEEDGW